MAKKSRKKRLKKIIVIILIIAILLYVGYSVYKYRQTGAETEGIRFCEGSECWWSAHIHAELQISVCGEDVRLSREKGDTGKAHTHKESDTIHWHDKIRTDEQGNILDTTPLMLKAFFEQIKINFNSTCIMDFCNGMLCNGDSGMLSMTVNGKENNKYGDYIWKDGDIIIINFS